MPKTEGDPLGPHLAGRLRAELDRVQPRFSSPRYQSAEVRRRLGVWRLAPVLLAIGVTGILGLTAWAATGSTDPGVWTERVTTVLHTAPSPTPESTPTPPRPQVLPPVAPARQTPVGPSAHPNPSSSPEPRESPEPSDDHSSYASGSRTSTPSPYPGDH